MRAAALRRQPDGWDVPTIEDDAETRVYFQPDPEPELLPALDALPLVRMSLPIDVAPVAPVARFQPVAVAVPPPVPPKPVPVFVAPPPAPRPVYVAPRPQPIPVTYARPRPAPALDAQRTTRVRKQPADARRTALIALAGACLFAGLMIGGAIALRGSHASHASASVVPAPAPTAAPVKVAAAPAVVAPAPAVAAVVTPIEAAPAPVADHRNVIIVSEEPPLAPPVPQPVQAVAPAPRAHRSHHVTAAPVAVAVAHAAVAPAPTAATGTLELSTKPPCEIVVDGKPTGFTTPHKGIVVTAGHHEVTLTNADQGIQLTTEVTVTAGKATRMIRDFTK